MYANPLIQQLDVTHAIYVLRDENGNSLGTGSKEALEGMLYIMEQAKCSESRRKISTVSRRNQPSTNVRSALVF